jgi:dextranase
MPASSDLPPRCRQVYADDALGRRFEASLEGTTARFFSLPAATYMLTASAEDGRESRVQTVVTEVRGDAPVPAFATSWADRREADDVLAWIRALRATVVQLYDWMASYSRPEPPAGDYRDPLQRPLSRPALEHLVAGVRAAGAVAQAYAPVCATDPPDAAHRPHLRLYQNDGRPQHLAYLLDIMHPGHPEWQASWLDAYGAARCLGFDGLHLDTYGYPRAASDGQGDPVDVRAAYASFIAAVRAAFPQWLITFNQVNGHPGRLAPSGRPAARYAEVWPPNDAWRHLEGVLSRIAAPPLASILAIYPPVWAMGDRAAALRTACLTEAVVCALGADALIWGDRRGVLNDAYYPRHVRLDPAEAAEVLRWHRFALRYRDLFRRGSDTSWEDVGGVNTAVRVDGAPALPEPVAGSIFTRVRRGRGWLAVSLLNLTGSDDGRWTTPTGPPIPVDLTVNALMPEPGRWRAAVAVQGRGEALAAAAPTEVPHPEGTALRLSLRALGTWAVVLFRTAEAAW